MKRLAAAVALMAAFTLAVCFILLGSISKEIQEKLAIDNSGFGTLVSALFFTSMIVQLFVGPLVDKVGHKAVAITGFLITSLSIFVLAFASSFALALMASCMLGLGAMCANTVANTLIPIVLFEGKEPARASNLGNSLVGLAFVLTPWGLSYSLHSLKISYEVSLSMAALLVLLFALVAFLPEYPHVAIGFKLSKAFELVKEAPVWIAGLALICYIALESTMNTWIKPLMTDILGGSGHEQAISQAGLVLGLFGLFMAVGRFLTSMIRNLTKIGAHLILAVSGVSLLAILVLMKTDSPAQATVAVIVAGLALAPVFPTIVGVTFSQYEPGLYGSIFGIIFAIGLLGPTVVPKLIGVLSTGGSLQQGLGVAAVMAALLGVLAFFMGKVAKR
jgi:fucose permease